MGEEISTEQAPKRSRRTAIKAAVAVGAAALLGLREADATKEGVQTKEGIFYPLYEKHTVGIERKNLPHDLDGFFREAFGREGLVFTTKPAELIHQMTLADDEQPVFKADDEHQVFKKEVLYTLARNRIRIIFGDIIVPPKLLGSSAVISFSRMVLGTTLVTGGAALTNEKKLDRRQFFQKALIITGASVASPLADKILPFPDDSKNAIQRIYIRLHGLISDTVPENHEIFFRNLVMADKLLTMGEELGCELGRKPRIALNVGSAHSGIEDFLKAGHEFTRWLITQYPEEFLRDIIKANGSLENFCTARVLTLPTEPGLFRLTADESPYNREFDESTHDVKVIDQPLLETLKEKLAKQLEQLRQEELKQREIDITAIKKVIKKHLSPSLYSKMDALLSSFSALNKDDYEQAVKVTITGAGIFPPGIIFRITLPGGQPPYPLKGSEDMQKQIDMEVFIEPRLGHEPFFEREPSFEDVSLYVNEKGEIRKKPIEQDIIAIPTEKLRPLILSSFLNTPENEGAWQDIPPDINLPGLSKHGLRSQVDDEHSSRTYLIGQNGFLQSTVRYKYQ